MESHDSQTKAAVSWARLRCLWSTVIGISWALSAKPPDPSFPHSPPIVCSSFGPGLILRHTHCARSIIISVTWDEIWDFHWNSWGKGSLCPRDAKLLERKSAVTFGKSCLKRKVCRQKSRTWKKRQMVGNVAWAPGSNCAWSPWTKELTLLLGKASGASFLTSAPKLCW